MGSQEGRGPQTVKTPAAKSLYMSIFLDNDIWHCFLLVLSFYAFVSLKSFLVTEKCYSQAFTPCFGSFELGKFQYYLFVIHRYCSRVPLFIGQNVNDQMCSIIFMNTSKSSKLPLGIGYFFNFYKSPGIDSKESILPAYVAWRAGSTTLFLLGSQSSQIFQNSSTGIRLFWEGGGFEGGGRGQSFVVFCCLTGQNPHWDCIFLMNEELPFSSSVGRKGRYNYLTPLHLETPQS